MADLTPVVTIETSRPGDAYTLLEAGTHLDVHLADLLERGTGAILCGFDRFARDEDGKRLSIGFSVGGGVKGPGYNHHACEGCASAVGDRPIGGLHAPLFGWQESHGFMGPRRRIEASA